MKNGATRKKIVVGLSGGVDSSVAAALLRTQGYEVVGVFLRLWKNTERHRKVQNDPVKSLRDNGAGTEREVRELCEKLGIPLKIIDARKKFREKVVRYFLEEYQAGRTPNPCVFCNENLKFKLLFDEAKKIGADWVATGHYARLRREITNNKLPASPTGRQITNKFQNLNSKSQTKLLKARDENKDQSYFLYRLNQKQLSKLIFPLGDYKKTEVRVRAREFDLVTAEKKESQNVCFLLDFDTAKFLKKNLKLKKGKIIDQNGEVVGEHEGLPLYTIGQRKGIKIGGTGPYYVSGKDLRRNILLVTNSPRNAELNLREIILENVSWTEKKIKTPFEAMVATRYQQKEIYATIAKHEGKAEYVVQFKSSQKFIASGQSAVFYSKKGEVLGGGIIK